MTNFDVSSHPEHIKTELLPAMYQIFSKVGNAVSVRFF